MTRQILVPLRGTDRIERYLPNLQQIARPGTKIVFFVHYGLNGFRALMDQLLAVQLGILPSNSNPNKLVVKPIGSGKHKVLPALEALKRKGAQIEVNLYGVSKVLEEYVDKKEVDLITDAPEPLGSDGSRDKVGAFGHSFQAPCLPTLTPRASGAHT